jgi:hypothetical protein
LHISLWIVGRGAGGQAAGAKLQQLQDVQQCVKLLADLHLKSLLTDAADAVASEEIAREVSERCSDCIDKACLAELQQWLLQTLVLWAESIIHAAVGSCSAVTSSAEHAPSPQPSWSQRLQRRLAQCFISCRTPQLFDMVKEYVKSFPFPILQSLSFSANL